MSCNTLQKYGKKRGWGRVAGGLLWLAAVAAAGAWPQIPAGAQDWQKLARQPQLPDGDVAASAALVPGWEGVGVLHFSSVRELALDFMPEAEGRYELRLGLLAGGAFAPVSVSLGDTELGLSPAGGAEAAPVVATFTTGLLPAAMQRLVLRPAAKGPIGVFMVDADLQTFAPVAAVAWRAANLPNAAAPDKLPAPFTTPEDLGCPRDFAWAAPAAAPNGELAPGGSSGVTVAVTHFHKPEAFTGYGFRLSATVPAALYANGALVAKVAAGETSRPLMIPWHKLGRANYGLTRFVVALAAGPESRFRFEASPLRGGRFLAEVPPQCLPVSARPPEDFPMATIDNGIVKAELPLPHPTRGYSRGSRFEPAGQIVALTSQGHSYFTAFHVPHDPQLVDAAAGPAEEFFEPLGWDEAAPGEPFIKVGIGLFEKPASGGYFQGATYWPVERFAWDTRIGQGEATFTQEVRGPHGYAYQYVKRLVLPPGKAELRLEHSLRNLGDKRLRTSQYCHNFVRIDDLPGGPDYRVQFAFPPSPARTVGFDLPRQGNTYTPTAKTYFSPLRGCLEMRQNRVTIRLGDKGPGVDIWGDFAPVRFWFFGNDRAICPEPAVQLDLPPGASRSWTREYRFFPGTPENPVQGPAKP